MIRENENNGGSSVFGTQQELDAVIIMTDQEPGSLLRRAAKLAVGDGVRIYGGRIKEFTLAAEGDAILAFRRRLCWYYKKAYDDGFTQVRPTCREYI